MKNFFWFKCLVICLRTTFSADFSQLIDQGTTETALLNIVNDLLLPLDNGNISLLASLDLSAAFDTIDHNILLHRLQHDFDLSGTVLYWFSSHLSGRIQSVSVPSHTSDTVKNLGVTLDCHLSLKTHVLNLVRTANFELCRISSIRSLLTTEATATLVSAFILSRLDYCNSLLSGCPPISDSPSPKGSEHNAARLILGISKFEHISPHLASLHWLPIDSCIKYKLACICYNSLSTNSPPYLSDLLTVYTTARQLRSCSDNSFLRRLSVRTVSYGKRSFAYSAPSAWNALPQQVRSSDSVSTFRSRTKTHLFRLAY